MVDDLLATGGSATAALLLIQKAQARPAGFYFLIELDGLSGRDRVATVSEGAPVHALFHF